MCLCVLILFYDKQLHQQAEINFLPQQAGHAEFPWLQHHSGQAAATQDEYEGVCPICLACWIGCHIQSHGGSLLHPFSLERHYPCPLLDYDEYRTVKLDMLVTYK